MLIDCLFSWFPGGRFHSHHSKWTGFLGRCEAIWFQFMDQLWEDLWNAPKHGELKEQACFPENILHRLCFPPVDLQHSVALERLQAKPLDSYRM